MVMKKVGMWGALAYLFVFAAIAYSAIKLAGGENHLLSANPLLLSFAVLAYLLSILFWAFAWASSGNIPFVEAAGLTFASASGAVTPLGAGSDALRGYFSGRSDIALADIVSSSLATKLQKLALTGLVSLAFLGVFFPELDPLVVTASSLGIALGFLGILAVWIASGKSGKILSFIPRRFIPEGLAHGSERFRDLLAKPSLAAVAFLFVSTFFEFASFVLCFLAFGADIGLPASFGAFTVIFFAAKLPFLHGFGLIELVGAVLLNSLLPVPQLVAILFAFDFCRLWFPTLLSLLFIAGKFGR